MKHASQAITRIEDHMGLTDDGNLAERLVIIINPQDHPYLHLDHFLLDVEVYGHCHSGVYGPEVDMTLMVKVRMKALVGL